MNEEITTFEGLKEEVARIEGFVEKMIPFHHPEPSLSPAEGERTEPVTSVSATVDAAGVPSPAPGAEPVAESAPSEPVLAESAPSVPVHVESAPSVPDAYAIVDPPMIQSAPSVPVHVLETRSFGRPTADHPMVINVTRGAS